MSDPPFPDPDSRNVLEPGCARCPALADSRERISWGNGSRDADVMVVGEAPAYGDPEADRWKGGNWTGLAYTSRHSGRLVRSLFADIGYGPDELYVTNAVKCFPAADRAPGDQRGGDPGTENREPTAAERATCFDHLRTELRTVDPTVVATTGRHATLALLEREGRDLDGFVESVLDPVECPTLDVTVLPLLHPSYQHVWLARLGHDRESYRAALGDALDELL